MFFVKRPSTTQTWVELPGGPYLKGAITFDNIVIGDCDLPLGVRVDELEVEGVVLYGVCPFKRIDERTIECGVSYWPYGAGERQ